MSMGSVTVLATLDQLRVAVFATRVDGLKRLVEIEQHVAEGEQPMFQAHTLDIVESGGETFFIACWSQIPAQEALRLVEVGVAACRGSTPLEEMVCLTSKP